MKLQISLCVILLVIVYMSTGATCDKLQWEDVYSNSVTQKTSKYLQKRPKDSNAISSAENQWNFWDILKKVWSFFFPADDITRVGSGPLGTVSDFINGSIKTFLDMLTLWLYHDKESDCGKKLLCEVSREASRRGPFSSVTAYVSSMFVSFWLKDLKMTESVEALRNGRRNEECKKLYPKCHLSL